MVCSRSRPWPPPSAVCSSGHRPVSDRRPARAGSSGSPFTAREWAAEPGNKPRAERKLSGESPSLSARPFGSIPRRDTPGPPRDHFGEGPHEERRPSSSRTEDGQHRPRPALPAGDLGAFALGCQLEAGASAAPDGPVCRRQEGAQAALSRTPASGSFSPAAKGGRRTLGHELLPRRGRRLVAIPISPMASAAFSRRLLSASLSAMHGHVDLIRGETAGLAEPRRRRRAVSTGRVLLEPRGLRRRGRDITGARRCGHQEGTSPSTFGSGEASCPPAASPSPGGADQKGHRLEGEMSFL